MGFVLAAILKLLLLIFSVLLHLACVAAIVILFVMRLNTQDEGKKSLYLKLMILAAVLLVGSLLVYPILLILGLTALFI